MFSKFKLALRLSDNLRALNEHGSDFQIEKTWEAEGLKTVHISILSNAKKYQAWGADSNEMLAFGKACMELIERLHIERDSLNWDCDHTNFDLNHLRTFQITSSGCAAHLDYASAKSAAWAELIERHTLSEVCSLELPPNLCAGDTFLWQGPDRYWVALAYYHLPDGGYLFGSAADRSQKNAVAKARLELAPMKKWSLNQANVDYLRNSLPVSGPDIVHQYHLSLESLPRFLTIQTSEHSHLSRAHLTPFFGRIKLLPGFNKVSGLCVVRAYSPEATPLSFAPLSGTEMRYTFVA